VANSTTLDSTDRLVLAYTGGLDAAVSLHWLSKNKDKEVVTFTGNIGQDCDMERIRKSALSNGVGNIQNTVVSDLRETFVKDFIFPVISANALYEGRYPLGGALPKPLLAKTQVEVAKERGIGTLAHGATAEQNDAVRFRKVYRHFSPKSLIYVPWEDPEFLSEFCSREDLLAYRQRYDLDSFTTTWRPWTTENHLLHTAFEDMELSDFGAKRSRNMNVGIPTLQEAPEETTCLEISFEQGIPVRIKHGEDVYTRPLEIMEALNYLGLKHAIGAIDIVETNLDGRKTRGVYVTPGGTILHTAHRDIECATMTGEKIIERDSMIPHFSGLIYSGEWYSPAMEYAKRAMIEYQKPVSGMVYLSLYKGNVTIEGRKPLT
jgi:argininosuccinate synthase